MSKVEKKQLLAVVGARFDWYSAQVVLAEALEKAGLAGKETLEGPEAVRLAGVLAGIRGRMEWVAWEVARLGGADGLPAAQPTAAHAAPVSQPAQASQPAPAAQAAPHAPAAHPAPAAKVEAKPAAPAPFEVAAGKATEVHAPARQPLRITSPSAGTLRWGVNGWKTPPAAAQPAGTQPVAGEPTVDTALAAAGGAFALLLGPFGDEVKQLDFTLRDEGGAWAAPCTVKLG